MKDAKYYMVTIQLAAGFCRRRSDSDAHDRGQRSASYSPILHQDLLPQQVVCHIKY
jgi:hypothetical protein